MDIVQYSVEDLAWNKINVMNNSSAVIDYVYYENNFTRDDVPKGVIPKYEFIVMPGVAYLYNGMPERTNYNDPYNVYVALIQFMIGSIGLGVHTFSIWTIKKNKHLSSSVKWFLFSDAGIRLFGCFMLFYQIECMFSWSCVDTHGYPFSWLLPNQILTTIDASLDPVTELLALGCSANRIFAVYFDGRYYDKAQKFAIPSVLFAFALPVISYLNFLGNRVGPSTHVLFYTGFYFTPLMYMEYLSNPKDMFTFSVLTLMPWFGYGWLGTALMLDLCTLWKVRKMKRASSSSKSRADLKLSVMTTCTVLVILADLLSFQLMTEYLATAEPLYIFLGGLPSYFFTIISGSMVVAFNYERKTTTRLFTRKKEVIVTNTVATSSSQTQTTELE